MMPRTRVLLAPVILAGFAAWGWLRKPGGSYSSSYRQPVDGEPLSYDSSSRLVTGLPHKN